LPGQSCIAAGTDVKAVQMILGHASATMTMDLYGHLFSEAPWLAMERMPTFPEPGGGCRRRAVSWRTGGAR